MATITIYNRAPFVRKFSVFSLAWEPSGVLYLTPKEAALAAQNSPDYQTRLNSGYFTIDGVDHKGRIIVRNTKPTAVRLRVPRLALKPGENIVDEELLHEIFQKDPQTLKVLVSLRGQPDGLGSPWPESLAAQYNIEALTQELVQVGQSHFPQAEQPLTEEKPIPEKTEDELYAAVFAETIAPLRR